MDLYFFFFFTPLFISHSPSLSLPLSPSLSLSLLSTRSTAIITCSWTGSWTGFTKQQLRGWKTWIRRWRSRTSPLAACWETWVLVWRQMHGTLTHIVVSNTTVCTMCVFRQTMKEWLKSEQREVRLEFFFYVSSIHSEINFQIFWLEFRWWGRRINVFMLFLKSAQAYLKLTIGIQVTECKFRNMPRCNQKKPNSTNDDQLMSNLCQKEQKPQ